MIDRLLVGPDRRPHLTEGVPAWPKPWPCARSQGLQLSFHRIQFTPDFCRRRDQHHIFNPRTGEFTIKKGPVSPTCSRREIKPPPAKVQSALLESDARKQ